RGSGNIRHGRVTKTNQPPENPERFRPCDLRLAIATEAGRGLFGVFLASREEARGGAEREERI
ncbi:hypothetical protein, partial [uncultured Marivita sp.]|uniref:hypothetical protein n=1 Tax=uncultured Marivita sp. TaxID=888080 RepID=UPI0026285FC3